MECLKNDSFCSRFPFSTSNPVGYGLAVIEQYIAIRYVYLFLGTMLSMEVGSFFLVIGLAKDSEYDLKLMDACAKGKMKRFNAMKHLCNFIKFHLNAKELSKFLLLSSST